MKNLFKTALLELENKALKECGDSSKKMIAKNITSFENMGMSHTKPGEFSPEEITDMSNLENTACMSNKGNCEDGNPIDDIFKNVTDDMNDMGDAMSGMVNISISSDNNTDDFDHMMHHHEHEEHMHNPDEEDMHHHHHHHDDEMEDHDHHHGFDKHNSMFHKKAHEVFNSDKFRESAFVKEVYKTLKESKLLESDYAAPLRYVPDTRINASDVLNALKKKIGNGSEGISVNCNVDDKGNNIYSISQIEKSKLPNNLDVENVSLKLTDDGYVIEKTSSDFPVKKD